MIEFWLIYSNYKEAYISVSVCFLLQTEVAATASIIIKVCDISSVHNKIL